MIKTICVCGAGTMGSGIAQVAAMSGFTTIQFDVEKSMLEKSLTNNLKNLEALVQKDRISNDEKIATINRLTFTNRIEECIAEVVIEAIMEKLEVKVELFNQLAAINTSQTILASNTSSLSIDDIAKAIENPSRVVGLHFFNPAPVMKLVEIVKGNQTSDEVVAQVKELAEQIGKTPVVCNDSPGFIVNRVARPYYIEALRLIEAGVADHETIDKALEAAGFKLGPFKLMDLIGLDINYSVSKSVWQALDKPERLTPSAIQKNKIDEGNLGRKTGRGFYNYDEL